VFLSLLSGLHCAKRQLGSAKKRTPIEKRFVYLTHARTALPLAVSSGNSNAADMITHEGSSST
jgi:hypothetical protein